jgi:D-alanyl-D-alanine carboxypeptidase
MKIKNIIYSLCTVLILLSCKNNSVDAIVQSDLAFENVALSTQSTNRLNVVLDSVCKKMNIKGASCAVFIPNKGVWEGAYGFSHGTTKINSNMALTIGSNTKTYIAVLMLKLQENGVLNLNDKVSKYLPKAPYINDAVTIKQLLNHTTGFGDFSFNEEFVQAIQANFKRVWQPIETYPYFEKPLAPYGTYLYSDQNYLLAGLVIEAATKKPLKTSMRELILTPNNLTKTVYYPFENTDLVIPHSWSADFGLGVLSDIDEVGGYSRIAFCSADNAAGGMLSTAKENALFWNRLMTGKIINQASLTLMKEFVATSDPNLQYGLGLYKSINSINKRTFIAHNGYVPGSINDNAYDPISGVCITVLTNQDQFRDLSPILAALHKVTL